MLSPRRYGTQQPRQERSLLHPRFRIGPGRPRRRIPPILATVQRLELATTAGVLLRSGMARRGATAPRTATEPGRTALGLRRGPTGAAATATMGTPRMGTARTDKVVRSRQARPR